MRYIPGEKNIKKEFLDDDADPVNTKLLSEDVLLYKDIKDDFLIDAYIPFDENIYPSEDDYKTGFYIRHFYKKRNLKKIKEIGKNQYLLIIKSSSFLYETFEVKWFLKYSENLESLNRNNVLDVDNKNRDLISYFVNYKEFSRK